MLLIPTPAPLSVGIIVGVTALIPFVFSRISTFDFPTVTLRSTLGTILLVLPSRTISFGGIENPRPKEVMPIESNDARELIFITCGKITVGVKVLSDGYLNPISLSEIDFTDPISEPTASSIAPLPAPDVTVVIPGSV